MKTITLEQGKYTIEHIDGVGLQARRYGEPWRDLTGDKLVLALVQRIEALDAARKDAQICGVCDGPNNYDPESGVCANCQDVR